MNTHNLSLRPSSIGEARKVTDHVNACYRGDSSRQGWTTEADLLGGSRTDQDEISALIERQDSVILLCLNQEKMIGSAHLQFKGEVCELGMLAIRPNQQGGGVGKWMLGAIENYAQQTWGVTKIQMKVITVRHELIAYYERRGYKPTGVTKPLNLETRNGIPYVELEFEFLEKELV